MIEFIKNNESYILTTTEHIPKTELNSLHFQIGTTEFYSSFCAVSCERVGI